MGVWGPARPPKVLPLTFCTFINGTIKKILRVQEISSLVGLGIALGVKDKTLGGLAAPQPPSLLKILTD